MAVPVAVRPLVAPAALHGEDDRVVAGARCPGVARGPVVGDSELAGGGERDPERVAEAVGPNRVARAEGIVSRDGPVRVVPENLAPDVRRVLRRRGDRKSVV